MSYNRINVNYYHNKQPRKCIVVQICQRLNLTYGKQGKQGTSTIFCRFNSPMVRDRVAISGSD